MLSGAGLAADLVRNPLTLFTRGVQRWAPSNTDGGMERGENLAMGTLEKAVETQLTNIEAKTGKQRQKLFAEVTGQGLAKHGEMVTWAKAAYGLGHGDANTLVHLARQAEAPVVEQADGDPADAIYTGAKAHLRPVHDQLMAAFAGFGAFDVAPKKNYLALRRRKQFAMLGPKTNSRLELGLNLKEEASHPLMKSLPPGGMCQYVVALETADQIDADLLDLARRAFDAAG